MSSCSTHSGASGFGCRLCFQWNPTSPLGFVCVPAKLGRALTLFLLSIHWDCPLSSVCQCCPRARVSVLPPGLADAVVHPRSSPGLPRRKQPVVNTAVPCLLPQPGREMCLPCITPAAVPPSRSSHEALHGLSLHSGLLQPVPPARPRVTSLEPSAAGPLSAAAVLPSHEGPAG